MHDYWKNHSSLPTVCSFLNLEDSRNTQMEVDIQTVGEGADSLCGLLPQLLGLLGEGPRGEGLWINQQGKG